MPWHPSGWQSAAPRLTHCQAGTTHRQGVPGRRRTPPLPSPLRRPAGPPPRPSPLPRPPRPACPTPGPHPSNVMRSPTGTPSGGLMGSTWSCASLEAHSTCGPVGGGGQCGVARPEPGFTSRGIARRCGRHGRLQAATRREGAEAAGGGVRVTCRQSRTRPAWRRSQPKHRPRTHHAIRHHFPHLGGLEVADHHHAPPLHLLLRHKLDQPADHLQGRVGWGGVGWGIRAGGGPCRPLLLALSRPAKTRAWAAAPSASTHHQQGSLAGWQAWVQEQTPKLAAAQQELHANGGCGSTRSSQQPSFALLGVWCGACV